MTTLLGIIWMTIRRKPGLSLYIKKNRLIWAIPVPLFIILILLVGQWMGPQKLKPLPAPGGKPDYSSLKTQLNRYLAGLPGVYGIYFKDLTSGVEMGINEDTPIPQASCIKVPVVLYLYQQVAAGKLRWSDRVAFRNTDYQTGDGALQYTARDGDTFSLRALANVSITISDNVAHNMLVRFLGYNQVLKFTRQLAPDVQRPFGSAPATAHDLGSIMEGVLDFAEKDPAAGRRLLGDLSHTIFHVGIPGRLPPQLQVAHKEGSIEGVADDMGIVFSQRPFIIVVMSHTPADENTAFLRISEISRFVYDYQAKLPPTPQPLLPR